MNFALTKSYQISLLIISLVGTCSSTVVNDQTVISNENNCIKLASIPCDKEFKSAKVSVDQKKEFCAAWGNLYAAYLAKNASTDSNSSEWKALKRNAFISNPFCELTPIGQDPELIKDLQICLDFPEPDQSVEIIDCQTNIADAYKALTVNYLAHMQEYLTSQSFQKFQNDPLDIHYNYATIHLASALEHLSNVCNITVDDKKMPRTHFAGDIKDLGIIVNVVNNSSYEFHVTESHAPQHPIAHIVSGLNGVNLYTAVLNQNVHNKKNKGINSKLSRSKFCFSQLDPSTKPGRKTQPLFTVEICTGAELVAFLKTLPRNDPKIFTMNGCPTSEEYLANETDIYMVLVKRSKKAKKANDQNQRIQAINLSAFTGPYLLTMQINEEEEKNDDEISSHTIKKNSSAKIIQPSFTSVQQISQKALKIGDSDKTLIPKPSKEQLDRSLLPLIILPKFLWDLPEMKIFWMLYSTSYISSMTDFSNFGFDKFGSAYDYFKDLGYFDMKQNYQFIIDRYNILKCGECLYDAKLFMGCALYESTLKTCSDISKIYSAIDEENNIVSNGPNGSNINFSMQFSPESVQYQNQSFFNHNGFNATYFIPYQQMAFFCFSSPTLKTKETIFAHITKSSKNMYYIALTDKNDFILDSKSIVLNFSISNIKIDYLTNLMTWKGSTISKDFIPLRIGDSMEFKIVDQVSDQKHELLALSTSPIDKLKVIYTCIITKYPITNLYFDIYKTFNIAPYYRLNIWQNENIPLFLQNLAEEDWRRGIYIVPTIQNHYNLSKQHPGFLTIIFYRSDKTILDSISIKEHFISTPVSAYNLYSDQFKFMPDIYLSTGIFIKYQPHIAIAGLSTKERIR